MRLGAIDIGTNTARLLIAEVAAGRVSDVERRAVVVGLGEGVDRSGRLSREAIGRTIGLLGEYAALLRVHRVERFRVVATSATRDAANAAEFLERASRVLGRTPEVIGGDEEARLSFEGAATTFSESGPTLVIDPGGGSTEFVLGGTSPMATSSVDIGSVRLTERLLRDRPAAPDQVRAAAAVVAEMFVGVDLPAVPARVIGVGGTFTSLAAIHLGLAAYDRSLVHGSTLTVEDLDGLVRRLSEMTLAETEAIPSLEPGRAPVLLGGAVVAREAARRAGVDPVIVSECDLLDGMVRGLAG
jgi:exopolyphosphatase/guanosine-5'-triphosphate,3'-diphosphate pyrophosphatase